VGLGFVTRPPSSSKAPIWMHALPRPAAGPRGTAASAWASVTWANWGTGQCPTTTSPMPLGPVCSTMRADCLRGTPFAVSGSKEAEGPVPTSAASRWLLSPIRTACYAVRATCQVPTITSFQGVGADPGHCGQKSMLYPPTSGLLCCLARSSGAQCPLIYVSRCGTARPRSVTCWS
jgi:hypothetical protein